MEKILLSNLRDKIFKRSALIQVNGLRDILELNDEFSGDELFTEIVRRSLANFEYYHPLILEMKIYYDEQSENSSERPMYFKMVDNFNCYLDGRLSEDQITLIPNSVNGIRTQGSYTTVGSYFRQTDYDRPYLQIAWGVGRYVVRGICNRPLIESYNPDKTYNDKASIYWMTFDGVRGKVFLDQVLCDTLDYVRSLKSNIVLPNFPAEIFGAADIAYQQIKMELDQYYLQSNWRGDLLV